MNWIFVFVFAGNIHAMAGALSEDECRVMLEITQHPQAVCINTERPSYRIYKEKP